MTNVTQNGSPKNQLMVVLQQTPPTAIAELEFVKDKFVTNYNACHREKAGELMYHRQVVYFKQAIAASDALKKADPFSLYACFLTLAVKNYSLDPEDSEVYLYTMGGKAVLKRQAGAHVRRLMETGQVFYADQAKLVYEGDEFEVVNGRVKKHVEKFQSETIIAGYIRFVLNKNGDDRFFIYRKSDWQAWRKKSQQANGDNWNGNDGQPGAAFLRTKIVLHAAKDKSWATGTTNPNVDQFDNIEIDEDEQLPEANPNASYKASMVVTPAGEMRDDESFVNSDQPETPTQTFTDDNF